METLTSIQMRAALEKLDRLLSSKFELIVGGGSAMVLAHGYPLATYDIDAIVRGGDFSSIEALVKQVAKELKIAADWLNPWFVTFTHVLPPPAEMKLITIYEGKNLTARALGLDEMLIMKSFAHRLKDIGHAKSLIKKGANVKKVKAHLESLKMKNIPGAEEALVFLEDLEDTP